MLELVIKHYAFSGIVLQLMIQKNVFYIDYFELFAITIDTFNQNSNVFETISNRHFATNSCPFIFYFSKKVVLYLLQYLSFKKYVKIVLPLETDTKTDPIRGGWGGELSVFCRSLGYERKKRFAQKFRHTLEWGLG